MAVLARWSGSAGPSRSHDLPARFGPLPGGAWPEPPQQAVVLPDGEARPEPPGRVRGGRASAPGWPLDDDYRGFLDLLAGHVATAVANARAYEEERQRAEALAELDRAKTAFFSNVSHEFRTPADAHARPGRGHAGPQPHRPVARRSQSQLEVVNRNGLRLLRLVNTLLDFSRIEAGRVRAVLPADRPRRLHRRPRQRLPCRPCERAGLRLVGGLPAAGRAGVRGPGDVGEGRPQPALQRLQVHLRGRDRRLAAAGRAGPPNCGCGTPARASPPRRCPGCSSGSTGSRTHGAGPTRAAASGWRWCRSWSSCTAARSPPRASSGRGRPSPCTVPLGSAHLPAGPDRGGPHPRLDRDGGQPLRRGGAAVAPRRAPEPGRRPLRTADLSRTAARPPTADRSTSRTTTGPACWWPTTTPTCGSTSSACWPSSTASRPCRTARRRWRRHGERPPDLILTDVMMPRLDGFGLLRELRADPRTQRRAGHPAVGPCGRGEPGRGHGGRGRRLPGQAVQRAGAAGPCVGPPANGPDAAREQRDAPAERGTAADGPDRCPHGGLAMEPGERSVRRLGQRRRGVRPAAGLSTWRTVKKGSPSSIPTTWNDTGRPS